jgi:hypothetical protein
LDTKRQVFDEYERKGEIAFMQEILEPLFDQMKFKRVIYHHGPGELGKDFILEKIGEFDIPEYYAVVVKKGGIQNTSGKDRANLDEVERQVGQSFKIKIKTPNGADELPSKVIVACSGRISKQASLQINNSIPSNYSTANVIYLSQDELLGLVEKHIPSIFHFQLPTLGRYLASLSEKLKEASCVDAKYSKILGKVGVTCYKSEPDKITGKLTTHSTDKKSSEIISNNCTVWLQGGSGYGKTYTVFQIVNKTLEELKNFEGKKIALTNRVVFYFKIQELKELIEQDNIMDALHAHISKSFVGLSREELLEWVIKYPTLFVVDEFEKISTPKIIDKFVSELKKFSGEPTILILSRVLGDFGNTFERKPIVYYIKEVKLNEAIEVLRENVPATSRKSLDSFNDLIKNGVLERIPRSALAINILSHLFSEEIENSPNNTFEFFDMFFEVALGRWREGRDSNKAYDYNQVRAFLEYAAFEMVSKNVSSIEVGLLKDAAQRILDSVGEVNFTPEEYIKNICDGSEVCRFVSGYLEFSHKTFMEFLAGCEFVKHKWEESFFINQITNPQWEDALIFAAGSKKRSEPLLGLLKSIPVSTLQSQFLKMKNISLVIQALYHSDMKAKVSALDAGIESAIRLGENTEFREIIKKNHKNSTDITCTVVAMSMFSFFYGRNSLAPVILANLTPRSSGRERSYLIGSLAAIELKENISIELNSYLKTYVPSPSEPESIALEPFLNAAKKLQSYNPKTIKLILENKRIKALGNKFQSYLKTGYKELIEHGKRNKFKK